MITNNADLNCIVSVYSCEISLTLTSVICCLILQAHHATCGNIELCFFFNYNILLPIMHFNIVQRKFLAFIQCQAKFRMLKGVYRHKKNV